MGRYDKYWPMRKPGGVEMFKCVECGGETATMDGFNGAPSLHNCRPGCSCKVGGQLASGVSARFRANFDRLFPNSPGADL